MIRGRRETDRQRGKRDREKERQREREKGGVSPWSPIRRPLGVATDNSFKVTD